MVWLEEITGLGDPGDGGRCHRTGFRLYWAWLSRNRRSAGKKKLSGEVRDLIFRMVAENPTWGAPRFHGELLARGLLCPSERFLAG